MRVIIVCAGDGSRWAEHLGVPKQLAVVDGEPLLHRAVRLWGEYSDDVVIVADDDRLAVEGARLEAPRQDPDMRSMGRYSSSRHLWDDQGRTLVLFGDVYWDEGAVKRLAKDRHRGWRWIARLDASEHTGKERPEGFGVSFYPSAHAEFSAAIDETARLHREGVTDRSLGFECWRVMQKCDTVRHAHPFPDVGRCLIVDDWTDDIDRPSEHSRLVVRRAEAAPATEGVVSVVVPMRGLDDQRALLWEWLSAVLALRHPDWEIVTASDMRADGRPFNRAAALIEGIRQASGDVIVVLDADTWSDRLDDAVEMVNTGQADWCMPHDTYVRLDEQATVAVLGGAHPGSQDSEPRWAEPPYAQRPGACPLVIRRDLALRIPPDQRYEGWGGEENSWGWALTALHGPVARLTGRAWHLWHEPQPHPTRHTGSPATEKLKARYKAAAATWGTEAMAQLVAEARGDAKEAPRASTPRPAGRYQSRRTRDDRRTWRHRTDGRTRTVRTGSAIDKRYERFEEWEQIG